MKLYLVIFMLLLSSVVNARSILQKVNNKFDESTFISELTFNKAPTAKNIFVEYINQTIQINIPGATVKKGKILAKLKVDKIKSVYSYQYAKNLMRTRIIFKKPTEATKFEGFVKVDRVGRKIIIYVYDPIMAKRVNMPLKDIKLTPPLDIAEQFEHSINIKSSIRAEDIVAREMSIVKVLPEKIAKKPLKAKSSRHRTVTKKEGTTKKSVESLDLNGLNENEIPIFTKSTVGKKKAETTYTKLIYSMIVLFVLSAGLILFARYWNKNNKLEVKNTKIKILTQQHIGPKKNLVIIRVAGESILLGVTDQNISMIKTLSFIDEEVVEDVPQNFSNAMDDAQEKIENHEVTVPKITYAPGRVPLGELQTQVTNKLKQLRNI